MPIPDYQSFFLPVLRLTADGKEHSLADLREKIAPELNFTPEDLSQKLPSGGQTVFANRVAWAAVYLLRALALDRIKRGVFRITDRGHELLALNLPKITNQILSRYPEFVISRKGQRKPTPRKRPAEPKLPKAETPEEQLANAYQVLTGDLGERYFGHREKILADLFREPSCGPAGRHGLRWLGRRCRESCW